MVGGNYLFRRCRDPRMAGARRRAPAVSDESSMERAAAGGNACLPVWLRLDIVEAHQVFMTLSTGGRLMSVYLAEMIGTMILIILGDGVVANVSLKKSKGQDSGWIVVATG